MIKVNGLKKHFGDIKAVDDISFDVERGSLFALLGLNGAGKTTTINVLCGTVKKDAGAVKIDGIGLDENPEAIKQRIGIVFQNSVLDGTLSVRANLLARGSLYGFPKAKLKERIHYVSETFLLGDLMGRPYKKLSGGQKRRVDIARAFLNEPKVLFLDEPTTGLDPATRILVWDIIERLKRETGLTVFLTTHYMEETVRADRVVILDEGKIMANDSPDALKTKYARDYVRLITPEASETAFMLNHEARKYVYKNGAYHVEVEDSADALRFLNRNHTLASEFEVIRGSMDDVFLNVTGKSIRGEGGV